MATKFYLPSEAASIPIGTTFSSSWEVTASQAFRARASTSKISTAMTTFNVTEASSTAKDIALAMYVSLPLTSGQTVTGGQAITGQCRVSETGSNNNMFWAIGIRVMAHDGTTQRKLMLDVTQNGSEAATSLTNRTYSTTSAATNYTTVAGDRIVIEIGMGGDPSGSNPHDFGMRLGDNAASDLPVNNTATTDDNPWVQLNDTLTFDSTYESMWEARHWAAALTGKYTNSIGY